MRDSRPAVEHEEAFHDDWAQDVDVSSIDVDRELGGPGDPENRVAIAYLEPLEGKRILDAGSGYGVASVYFACRGAHVTALDVSSRMLGRVRELAARYEVDRRIETLLCPLEEAGSTGATYDAVYGYGVLHHADLPGALTAVKSALRPGGRAVFIEPLGVSPLVNLYRRLSPRLRTEDERPFGRSELRAVKRVFPRSVHIEVQLLSLSVYAFLALFGGLDLNRDRLWKVLSDPRHAGLARISDWLSTVDSHLIRVFPALGLFSWATVIVADRPPDHRPDAAGQ